MATGDQADMAARLRALLPGGWFGDATPLLDGVLAGCASALAWTYGLIQSALSAVLITTADGVFLDLHARDYLGESLLRRNGESDASYRPRVQAAIFPPAVTRAALIARLTFLTGRKPVVFEPRQPMDTGGYGNGSLGYGVAGGYGSLALPFQAFVTAYRPVSQGVPLLAGYDGDAAAPVYAPLGYGQGIGSYIGAATAIDGVTDSDIYAAIAAVEPAGSIIWARISS